jgi:RNA polymerase sigma-70 factor (ECF subfamily)
LVPQSFSGLSAAGNKTHGGIPLNGIALQRLDIPGCLHHNTREDCHTASYLSAFRISATPAMKSSVQPPGSEGDGQPSSATPRSLLERIKADEPAAWNRLVALYAPLVFQWCRRWELQEQDVSDIVQEVFQSVVTAIGSFRKEREGDTFRGWLRRITQNKVYDHFRRLGREPGGVGGTDALRRLSQMPVPPTPEESSKADEPAEQQLFHRALDLIRSDFEDRTWQAFWRTAIEDQAPKDVAADLAMSPCAVRVAKCRVLRRLRAELGDLIE